MGSTDADRRDSVSGTLAGPGVLLVDFWASWCDVCQATSLLAEELAEHYRGRIRTMRIDVDQDPVVAARYHVQVVPTLALLEDGQLAEQFVGFVPREKVQESIEWLLQRQQGRSTATA